MICKYCGQPTTELFTMSGDRVYVHFECMLKRGGELIESGAADDLPPASRGRIARPRS